MRPHGAPHEASLFVEIMYMTLVPTHSQRDQTERALHSDPAISSTEMTRRLPRHRTATTFIIGTSLSQSFDGMAGGDVLVRIIRLPAAAAAAAVTMSTNKCRLLTVAYVRRRPEPADINHF